MGAKGYYYYRYATTSGMFHGKEINFPTWIFGPLFGTVRRMQSRLFGPS